VDGVVPCGGCGATSESDRCIGCMHDFTGSRSTSQWLEREGPADRSKHPFLTGSHAYGTPGADSDIDMVVWAEDEALRKLLVGSGYPVRFGKLNIIICDNEADWNIWVKGTEALKRNAPVDRETAVELFQALGLSQSDQHERPYSAQVTEG